MQLQQRNKYLETTIQTATPAQLLLLLFDGAIRHCRIGVEALKSNKVSVASESLLKVQSIINEFIVTLDRSSPLADSLLQLYDYFLRRLVEANVQKSAVPAEEVLAYLIELKETWMQAVKQTSGNSVYSGATANGAASAAVRTTVI